MWRLVGGFAGLVLLPSWELVDPLVLQKRWLVVRILKELTQTQDKSQKTHFAIELMLETMTNWCLNRDKNETCPVCSVLVGFSIWSVVRLPVLPAHLQLPCPLNVFNTMKRGQNWKWNNSCGQVGAEAVLLFRSDTAVVTRVRTRGSEGCVKCRSALMTTGVYLTCAWIKKRPNS